MKAMILAAGRGERMRPLTDLTPKPLLKAGGLPLLEHTIVRLSASGFREVIVNTAHLGEQIVEYFGDGSRWGVNLQYSPEETALETGGGIFRALPMLGPEPFLVINGDIACNFPYETLKKRKIPLAHLVLVPNPPHHPAGDFALSENGLVESVGSEKFTFSGVGVYRPELFSDCQEPRFPLAPLLRSAMGAGGVTGEVFGGFWMDIGTVERLEAFDRHLSVQVGGV
jgi:MurNAc alpha-1-phosphate uridylyltransferase